MNENKQNIKITDEILKDLKPDVLCKEGYNSKCKDCVEHCNFMLTKLECDECGKPFKERNIYDFLHHEYYWITDRGLCRNCIKQKLKENPDLKLFSKLISFAFSILLNITNKKIEG